MRRSPISVPFEGGDLWRAGRMDVDALYPTDRVPGFIDEIQVSGDVVWDLEAVASGD